MRTGAARCVAALGVVLVVVALAGCGSSSNVAVPGGAPTPASVSHPKTKFVLHAGLAFGAFYHWIYQPAKAGDFAHPFLHKFTVLKAVLAGAFVYHELKLALMDAQADPTLSKLVAPITALEGKLQALATNIKAGHLDTSAITQASGSIQSLSQLASQSGQKLSNLLPSNL
jgi:hypothetical protein